MNKVNQLRRIGNALLQGIFSGRSISSTSVRDCGAATQQNDNPIQFGRNFRLGLRFVVPTPPFRSEARSLRRSSMPSCLSSTLCVSGIVLAVDGERTAFLRSWNQPEVEKLLYSRLCSLPPL
jgi:hypothetical protein